MKYWLGGDGAFSERWANNRAATSRGNVDFFKARSFNSTQEPACKVRILSKESWPLQAGWPYIRVVTQYSWFWLGAAKNWPYICIRNDLTSMDLTSGLRCTNRLSLLGSFLFIPLNRLHRDSGITLNEGFLELRIICLQILPTFIL